MTTGNTRVFIVTLYGGENLAGKREQGRLPPWTGRANTCTRMKHGWVLAVVLLLSFDRAAGQDAAATGATNSGSPGDAAPEVTQSPHAEAENIPAAPAPTPAVSSPEAEAQARITAINALFTAVFHDETDRVRELLATGVNPNDTMPLPVDPDLAALFRPTVLNYFLSAGEGLTPLMVAATLGHHETASALLNAGANPNARLKLHGTNALWLAGYMGHTDVTKLLLGVEPGSDADRMRIEVDLDAQTAQLFVDGAPEEAVPISSGRKGYPTPRGEFVVTDKHRHWRSTIYGANMPFYLRLSCRAFGLHAGHLPGYPASHGCIRLKKQDAQNFFERVPEGTLVVIK